ncbi:protein kinase [Frigoribacterium sp. R86507]|uniref:serine/threonine-protein kinase n=1 Tax=Frigoribacterium sp. R86507 TaxID=3093850 RepID=UPI0037C5221A
MAQSRSGDALGASYRLVELIGSGAAGEVWRATVAPDVDEVAAKLLKPEHAADPGLVERFVRERSVLVSLRHPGIVRVRDLVVEGERLAIVMDLVPGGSVGDVVAADGPLAAADALTVAAEVLDALAAAHALDVSHRDVKPDNVLLAETWRPGLTGAVRVTDFGIASVVGERDRQTTGLLGTPQYMAPELISTGRSGPAGDVYATGVMLYELLAGRTPFAGPGTDFSIAYRHVTSSPPRIDVPDDVWAAVEAMLAKDPSARPAAPVAAARLRRLTKAHAGLAALPRATAPDGFDEIERPATIVRGAAAGSVAGTGPDSPDGGAGRDDHAPRDGEAADQEARPDLGTNGSATVVRPLRRPVVAPAPVTEAPPTTRVEALLRHRPEWLTNRVAAWGAGGIVVAAALVVALVVLVPGSSAPKPDGGPGAEAARSNQQDPALPSGLGVSRTATSDPDAGTVTLTVTYSAQAAPLSGPLLEVVPGATEGDSCPPVDWRAPSGTVSAARNQPSLTGLTVACGWTLSDLEVPAGGRVEVEATVPLELADAAALDEWLQTASTATADAVSDPAVTGTAYPVQRLVDVQVSTPSRTVSQTTLPVTLLPVWPSGPDQLNPLYASPSTGSPSTMLTDVAGGESGVRFSDGCSGALAVSSDGLVVTALSVAPQCVLRATVGNFTNLESPTFGITTRE